MTRGLIGTGQKFFGTGGPAVQHQAASVTGGMPRALPNREAVAGLTLADLLRPATGSRPAETELDRLIGTIRDGRASVELFDTPPGHYLG